MRLLEEAEAAAHHIWDVALGQLDLKLHRVIVRAVQHRHLVQAHSLVHQLEDPLTHELALLVHIAHAD